METVPYVTASYPDIVCPRCLRELFLIRADEAESRTDILLCCVHGDVMTREDGDKQIQRDKTQ